MCLWEGDDLWEVILFIAHLYLLELMLQKVSSKSFVFSHAECFVYLDL